MKTKSTPAARYNHVIYIALITLGILVLPFVLTLRGSGVDGEGLHWTASDFVVMGILIFGTGLLLNLIFTRVRDNKKRLVLGAAILLVFLLVWAELAVGVFGTPLAGN